MIKPHSLLLACLCALSLGAAPLHAEERAKGPLLTASAATELTTELLSDDEIFGDDTQKATIADPLEPFNRGMFWVNDKLYVYLFKPVARAWRIVPEPARVSLDNAFSNLGTPVRLANALLQLRIKEVGHELSRFLINSTVGVAGLFDPAKGWGLAKHSEDLGQTLGHYGVGQGFYLVLPVLGPTSLRDGVGRVGDYFLEPLPYLLHSDGALAARILDRENDLSLDKDSYEATKRQELDPYLFIRNAYAQRRAKLVED